MIENRSCRFPRVGCRFMDVSAGFVVIINILFSESEYWVDVGRREISPRQEHEGEPPTFDDFGHAGEGWPAAGCARPRTHLDVALHVGSASAAALTPSG